MRILTILAAFAAAGCGAPASHLQRANAEIARLRCENFVLRLKEARRDMRRTEECRLLREEGLPSTLPGLRLLALKEILSAADPTALADCGLADPLARLVFTEQDPAILEKAVDAAAILRCPSTEAAVVAALNRTTSPEVRWSCINAIGKLQVVTAATSIRPFAMPGHPVVLRELAIQVLGKLKDLGSVDLIIGVLARDPEERIRETSARALGLLGGSPAVAALLTSFHDDDSPPVRKMSWMSLLALHPDYDSLSRFAGELVNGPWRPEWLEIGNRLVAFKPNPVAGTVSFLEKAASKASDTRDETALLRMAVTLDMRFDLLRKAADAQRRNHDYVGAQRTIGEALDRTAPLGAPWWEAKIDRLIILQDAESMAEAAAEATDLLALKPPGDVRVRIEKYREQSCVELANQMAGSEPAHRTAALEAARKVAKKVAPGLAAALGNPAHIASRPKILAAGNCLAETSFDISDESKIKPICDAWRAWAAK